MCLLDVHGINHQQRTGASSYGEESDVPMEVVLH